MNYQDEQEAMEMVEAWLCVIGVCVIAAVLYRLAEWLL